MIKDKDLLNIGYYHYGQAFFGSCLSLHYRLAREPLEDVHMLSQEEKADAKFKLSIWKGPFGYDKTDKENIKDVFFEYSEFGLSEVIKYLNRHSGNFSA